jgi:hypothetical protein
MEERQRQRGDGTLTKISMPPQSSDYIHQTQKTLFQNFQKSGLEDVFFESRKSKSSFAAGANSKVRSSEFAAEFKLKVLVNLQQISRLRFSAFAAEFTV